MPGFAFCLISNAKLFLAMCGHTSASKTKAEEEIEGKTKIGSGFELGIKWQKYLQRGVSNKGCHREGEESGRKCCGNQLWMVCFYLL